MREASDGDGWAKVQQALQPPTLTREQGGAPAWYGTDDDAWDEWAKAAKR